MNELSLKQKRVRLLLAQIAQRGDIITYQNLCGRANLPFDMANPQHRMEIGDFLEDISTEEHKNGRPLLSSIVLRSKDGGEGEGFYKMAARLGYGNLSKLKKEGTFQAEMMKKTFDFWKSDDGQRLISQWEKQINK